MGFEFRTSTEQSDLSICGFGPEGSVARWVPDWLGTWGVADLHLLDLLCVLAFGSDGPHAAACHFRPLQGHMHS